MARTRSAVLPSPRRPDPPAREGREGCEGRHGDRTRLWYENVLGWPTVPGVPPRLVVGVRFDVLDVPAEAGHAALERLGGAARGFPVALQGSRMRLLVAAGGADELPGLLEWLEWGGLGLDLRALGEGCRMDAPAPWTAGTAAEAGLPRGRPDAGRPGEEGLRGRDRSQGAAVWLRPPEPGREAETSLPTLSAMGTRNPRGDADGPADLVRLVNTLATQIHRVRLRRSAAGAAVHGVDQPLAFS
ncbi:SCO3374 family protein [Streptomyces lusitanus]|uniref:SCO3374 family protein n=1 Tax=Streptomyces lusitanus TaxID=68232 RepID=A0ABU3JVT1_9ACTN|nr:SCO3374 family protein [Streptomyces lusitanus]